ncbi:hypothetical protein [Bacillus sp. USDA818B3_A]|uniref:hypothetical protein n=1 Tax=Bacillus sp. USDA818B3_A TaxID=2698834 RepID=UPI001369AA24|nr:hypothetical protein [Bacillus sp. USDA818B3_A]
MKNERGYALVIVLLIITLSMILGLALSGAVLTTNKQVYKSDNINKATDLAEMGITYYQTAINTLINDTQAAIKVNNKDFCTEFLNQETLKTSLYSSKPIDSTNNKYKIDKVAPIQCSNVGQFKFKFISTGTTSSGETKQLQGTISISQIRIGKDMPDYLAFTDPGINKLNYSITFPSTQYPLGVKFTSGLTIVGNNILTVVKSAYFNTLEINGGSQVIVQETAIINKITSVNGNTNLKIYGDAIFLSDTPRIDKIAGQADICIYGNIYTVKDNKLVDYPDFSTYFKNSCQNTNSSWTVNPESGVTVTY